MKRAVSLVAALALFLTGCRLVISSPAGDVVYYVAPEFATPGVVATATVSPPATLTLTPTVTFVTPEPSPTAQAETPVPGTLVPTLPPVTGCEVGIAASTLNVRPAPGDFSAVIAQVRNPDRYEVLAVQWRGSDEWALIQVGSKTGWIAVFYQGVHNARYPDPDTCLEIRFPPVTQAVPARGLNANVGANESAIVNLVRSGTLGSIKGTTGTASLMRAARAASPDVLLTWRNLTRPAFGWQDCYPGWGQGDPFNAADLWWSYELLQWQAEGLLVPGLVDYFEVRNECVFAGDWEIAFDFRLVERANAAGLCLGLFSDAYGNPQITEFVQRWPVLDLVLAHECRPGRHHVIAYHVYEGTGGGAWKIGRPDLFRAALGDKYNGIAWLITEYGYGEGRGALDVGAFWSDDAAALAYYRARTWVLAYQHFATGAGPWTDVLPGLAG